MSERRLTILGGHRDGDVVSDCGPVLRVPVPRPPTYIEEAVPSIDVSFPVDEHRAQQDDDGRWWYVRRGRE